MIVCSFGDQTAELTDRAWRSDDPALERSLNCLIPPIHGAEPNVERATAVHAVNVLDGRIVRDGSYPLKTGRKPGKVY